MKAQSKKSYKLDADSYLRMQCSVTDDIVSSHFAGTKIYNLNHNVFIFKGNIDNITQYYQAFIITIKSVMGIRI